MKWRGHVQVQAKLVGVKLFSYVDASFGIIASHVVKTLYIRKLSLLVRRCPELLFFPQSDHIKQEISQNHSLKLIIIFLKISL